MSLLNSSGKLKDHVLPAMYWDSSVLIDCWVTEGMESSETEVNEIIQRNELPHYQVVKDLLRSEVKISKMAEIRKKHLRGSSNCS